MCVEQEAVYPLDAAFDVDLANRLAYLESYNKHYYRPNSYLHKWWARRCGTTFRHILKHLVLDPRRQGYYTPGGLQGRIILDPMFGGGTTLHEALRLGASVIGVDLDPIPVLQARATLTEYPLPRLERAFASLLGELREELAPLYRTTCPLCGEEAESWYLLHGARRSCACGSVLVVDSLTLREETDGSTIVLCPFCAALHAGDEACSCGARTTPRIVEHGRGCCPTCEQAYQDDLARPYYRRFQPLAVTGHCAQHNLFFKAPGELVRRGLTEADRARATLTLSRDDFVVDPGEKSIQLARRAVDNYLDLYTSRQLLVLDRAVAKLSDYAAVERLNLALLISTALEFNTLLCGYKGKGKRRSGAIRHTFARHAYTFPNTAVENNPLYPRRASGTWQKLFHMRIRRARKWAAAPRERDLTQEKATFIRIAGEVDAGTEVTDYEALGGGDRRFLLRQGSATRLELPDQSVDSIVTDPPYYDSVQYSDLSAFFRVWLRQMLPEGADWQVDLRESAVDPHGKGRDSRFTELMGSIFKECARVLRRPHGRLVFTYHHWSPLAWAALTTALQEAGFRLLNYAVVHAEHPISVHIANMNALTHDAILVLAPEGVAQPPQWPAATVVDKSSSAAFCTGCAELLGRALAQRMTPEESIRYWQERL